MKRLSGPSGNDVRGVALRNENGHVPAPADFGARIASLHGTLRARAMSLAQDRSDADDLVQATMEKALVASGRFTVGTNVEAWLHTILRNVFIDERRRHGRIVSLDGDVAAAPPDEPDRLDFLTVDDLDAALATLQPWQQEIFHLAYREKMSYRDIAAHLTIPSSTVGTRLTRVKAKLRQQLEDVYVQNRQQCSF